MRLDDFRSTLKEIVYKQKREDIMQSSLDRLEMTQKRTIEFRDADLYNEESRIGGVASK
jgi:hypothetical protein